MDLIADTLAGADRADLDGSVRLISTEIHSLAKAAWESGS
jgi:hypothetical protein